MLDTRVTAETRARYDEHRAQRGRNLDMVNARFTLEVDSPDWASKFLSRRGFSRQAAERIAADIMADEPGTGAIQRLGELGLGRVLGSSDLMGIAFLARGMRVARYVG